MTFHVEHIIEKFFPNKNLDEIFSKFCLLKEHYFKWNQNVNISSIRDEDGFWLKHIIDGLCLAKYIDDNYKNKEILDVGSGGGFPALVLAIVLDSKVVALEPLRKKTDFIEYSSVKLGLKNITIINSKFGNIKKSYPIVASRALGMYNELCRHFFKLDPKTKVIIMTTNKGLKQLEVNYKTITTQYDYVKSIHSNVLENYVLCECFSQKNQLK